MKKVFLPAVIVILLLILLPAAFFFIKRGQKTEKISQTSVTPPTITTTPTLTASPGCWDLCNPHLPNSCLPTYICVEFGTSAHCVADTTKCLPLDQNSDCTCPDLPADSTLSGTPISTLSFTPTLTPTRIKLPNAGFDFPLQGLVLIGTIISLLGIFILL